MSEDQYKACLTSVPEDNIKAKCKLHTKTFSLSNMGEQALKSHAVGKKHITVVTQTQKTDSVTDFFTVKIGVTPGAFSSAKVVHHPHHLSVILKIQTKIQEVWQHIGESYDKICHQERTTQS